MKPRRYPETKLKAAILAYLKTQRDVWAERRNAGRRPWTNKGVTGALTLGEPGTPDITGYLSRNAPTLPSVLAVPFGIEVKLEDGRLNDNQKKWHAKAREFGIPVVVARSISDAKVFIERLRKGDWA